MDELTDYIKKSCFAQTHCTKIYIAYCGHGDQRGSIELFDGSYPASELQDAFGITEFLSHPTISFIFNCCYSLDVCASLLKDDPRYQPDPKIAITNAYKCVSDYHNPYLKYAIESIHHRSFINTEWKGQQVSIFPLSDDKVPPPGFFPPLLKENDIDVCDGQDLGFHRARSWETEAGCLGLFPRLQLAIKGNNSL
eukprot:gene19669-23555_t